VPPYYFALIYLFLGEIDKCLDWLERGIDEHYAGIAQNTVDPIFNSLRFHLRYRALLRKMNLAL
jgi:hypothetical protein